MYSLERFVRLLGKNTASRNGFQHFTSIWNLAVRPQVGGCRLSFGGSRGVFGSIHDIRSTDNIWHKQEFKVYY